MRSVTVVVVDEGGVDPVSDKPALRLFIKTQRVIYTFFLEEAVSQ